MNDLLFVSKSGPMINFGDLDIGVALKNEIITKVHHERDMKEMADLRYNSINNYFPIENTKELTTILDLNLNRDVISIIHQYISIQFDFAFLETISPFINEKGIRGEKIVTLLPSNFVIEPTYPGTCGFSINELEKLSPYMRDIALGNHIITRDVDMITVKIGGGNAHVDVMPHASGCFHANHILDSLIKLAETVRLNIKYGICIYSIKCYVKSGRKVLTLRARRRVRGG